VWGELMQKCIVCEAWGKNDKHLHIEEEIEGLLEQTDIERNETTEENELLNLHDDIIVYRYVWSASDLFKIAANHSLASVSKCLCINCIRYSLSFIPHYGDGAYCTSNENLKNEDPRIIHSHGIYIREMNYRVVLKINDVSFYKKISRTAGVIRSIPDGQELLEGDLVFTEKGTIKIINFQQWNGNDWVDIILEELKGVS
jgi:hypothetical protein